MFEEIQKFKKEKQERVEQKEQQLEAAEKVFRPHLEERKFTVLYQRSKLEAVTGKIRKIFDVKGHRIEQMVKMTDIENPEGLERVYHFLNKMGIRHELRRQGASPGDKIRIAGKTFKMR